MPSDRKFGLMAQFTFFLAKKLFIYICKIFFLYRSAQPPSLRSRSARPPLCRPNPTQSPQRRNTMILNLISLISLILILSCTTYNYEIRFVALIHY